MAACKVAYNTSSNVYLRRAADGWYTTNDCTAAYAASDEKLRRAIVDVGCHVPGGWIIMKASDANKLYPRRGSIVHKLISPIQKRPKQIGASVNGYTMPRTENCDKILSTAKTLSELISDDAMRRLSSRQAAADRAVIDLYHSIEVSNFNACQGYKAYRKLKEALIARRKVKNEYALALHLRQSCLNDVSKLEMLSERAWDPQVDIFSEVVPNE